MPAIVPAIVDGHCKPPLPTYLGSQPFDLEYMAGSRAKRGYGIDETLRTGSIDSFTADQDRAGIVHSLIQVDWMRDVEQVRSFIRSSGRSYGIVLGVDTARAAPDPAGYLGGLDLTGVSAFRLWPGESAVPMHADDDRLTGLLEALGAIGKPVFMLTGGFAGPDLSYADPAALDRVAVRHPGLRFVAMHGSWPYTRELCGVLYRRPNVWAMPDIYFPGLPGEEDFLSAMRSFGSERIIFGTAYPSCPVVECVERWLRLPVPADCLDRAMGGNLASLLGLDRSRLG